MTFVPEELFQIFLAFVIGGAIGAEREFRHRAAGLRTIILICLGSTLFTMLSLRLGGDASPVRIAAHMVTGVGFLCAGVVMEEGTKVVGLTTAATIWFTAAMGMGIGGRQYSLVSFGIVAALIVLWVFPRFEEWIYNVRERRTYEVVAKIGSYPLDELERQFERCGLVINGHKLFKSDSDLSYHVEASGSPASHERLTVLLIEDANIMHFRY